MTDSRLSRCAQDDRADPAALRRLARWMNVSGIDTMGDDELRIEMKWQLDPYGYDQGMYGT